MDSLLGSRDQHMYLQWFVFAKRMEHCDFVSIIVSLIVEQFQADILYHGSKKLSVV
jgi:hypothetical protein